MAPSADPHSPAAKSAAGHQRELVSLLLLPVTQACLQPPFYLDGNLDLVSACRLLAQQQLNYALVRDGSSGHERIGIFTTTDLRDALLAAKPPDQLRLHEVAHFDLVSLGPQVNLAAALLLMLRHRIHRLVIKDGQHIVGLLSQLELMHFISSHSHLMALQVEHAQSIEELRQAALQADQAINDLQLAGLRIDIIAKLASEINNQLFARLWSLLAPIELQHNSCLLVMGSQGRGEQILKTDQDNALLLRNDYCCPDVPHICQQFNAALLSFGYPPCPGQVMLTNPLWCATLETFRAHITSWLFDAQPDGQIKLAIFLDAKAVYGDASLLANARAHALQLAAGSTSYLARMASAIDQFSPPAPRWWARLGKTQAKAGNYLDLKKSGLFAIVHGARTLALEHQLQELGSAERLHELARRQVLPATLAHDLVQSLHLLLKLKLRCNLAQQAKGQPINAQVDLATLDRLECDSLQDALLIVKQFKQHLRLHYRLPT